jgi:hypothetical protein
VFEPGAGSGSISYFSSLAAPFGICFRTGPFFGQPGDQSASPKAALYIRALSFNAAIVLSRLALVAGFQQTAGKRKKISNAF